MTTQFPELILPPRYENIASLLKDNSARMMEIVVPLHNYERQITEILADIRRNASGYVVFVKGVTGVGKTTFINSLELRKQYLPVRRLINIDATRFAGPDKLSQIYERLNEIAQEESQYTRNDVFPCIALNYLENLDDETDRSIMAFFRDLNGLLRRAPLLVLWPVTKDNNLQEILGAVRDVSGTLANPRTPVIDFSGPPMNKFADITKNTIRVLNDGRPVTDFQLEEDDFETIREMLRDAPRDKQTIGEYLRQVRRLWEKRTDYIDRLADTVPDRTEVWFMVCYPNAEDQIERFSKKTFSVIDDNWNINYLKLSDYVLRGQQRGAHWQDHRLLYALNVFRAKILYLPTNSFVNAVAAFGSEVPGFPITRDQFRAWGVPNRWFAKSKARLTLGTSPIVRQLIRREPSVGGRAGGGNRARAVENATESFRRINDGVSSSAYSDMYFNRALARALSAAYHNPPNKLSHDFPPKRPELTFKAEEGHRWLRLVPDITISGFEDKTICVEMYYTFSPKDNDIADYVLKKLDIYMAQYEGLLRQPALLGTE